MILEPLEQRPARVRPRLATGAAVVLLAVLPLVPGAFATGSVTGLARIPVESLVVLLVLAVIPWRMPRLAVAVLFGVFVAVAVLLAGVDRGYEAALGIHFVPLDWPQIGDAYGVVAAALGELPATALFAAAVLVLVAIAAGLAWAALRVGAGVRRRGGERTALAVVTATWVVAALAAPPPLATGPVAAAASAGSIGSAVSRTVSALETRAAVAHSIADDPFADVPADSLLTALRGKDVVIVFVESYGRAAVEGTSFSRGVSDVLRRSEATLEAKGYAAQSAWLTSPTFGGASWLAHATLQSGVWVDSQAVYTQVVDSDRLTLSEAFRRAGWRTVSDVPSNTRAWPVGTSFYHYDTLLDANNVGYDGPAFGYARIPDQYTLKHFAERELAAGHAPVMAEIDLVSSHTPWAPLPQLVPWARAGDGSVYDEQPEQSLSAGEVWQDPRMVQRFYGLSIEYSLGALTSFLENVDDPDLVVIVLGDHQPAAIVSGEDAGRDVPISVIAQDPAVFDAIASWRWQDGMHPAEEAPVWRMDEFRDRLLSAFGARG